MKLTPAAKNVYDHLCSHSTLTRLEAQATYRIFDLPGRIMEVRKALDVENEKRKPDELYTFIERVMKRDALGKQYASYSLVKRVVPRSLVVAGALRKLA